MGALFGGSQSTQSSSSRNVNNNYLKQSLDPQIQLGSQAGTLLASLFGIGGREAGDQAFNQYKNSSAYNFLQDEGIRGVTNSTAARGLLGSGGMYKALMNRSQNTANTFQNDYFDRLLGLGNMGNQAASIVGSAGQVSQSQGKSKEKPGIGGFLGSLASGVAASDRRLKVNIEKLGELYDGLGLYAWNYIWGGARRIGVMADEVAKFRPWALGPTVEGYATVNYRKL